MRTKEELFNYIGAEDSIYGYSRSYKLVLYKILFADMWEGKKSYVYDVASKFKDFYAKRIIEGKIPDKDVDERIEKANLSSTSDILEVIKINPYKHINANGFLEILSDDKGEYFAFPKEVVTKIEKGEVFRLITLIYKKLNLYFSRIDSGNKTVTNAFYLPQLGQQEYKYAEIVNGILVKFSKLNADSIIEKILESKEEYDSICDTIKAILRWKRLSYITAFYKELIALFLVGTAKYFYNDGEGGFWRQVEKIIPQINGNNHADIVDAFYSVIKKYGLPDFEEERNEGYKLIAPIICHAGIPINCFDSWLDVVYQMRGVKYAYIENELDFACRYADQPVKRYVNFLSGRAILADEVQQLQELISCVLSNKEIPGTLDFSYEMKIAAIDWAQSKRKNGPMVQRFATPELIFDCDTYGLSVRLPKMKLKDERWVLWEISVGETTFKKKVYGKAIESGYFYSDCEISINPAKTITAQLMSDNGRFLDEFYLKAEKDYLIFNNNGKQNKSKFIPKKPSYFICDNSVSVCDNLQIAYEYDEYVAFVNNPETEKEVWIENNGLRSTYVVREKPELSGGQILFNGNADFEDIDVYSKMPQISIPFDGEWEITLIDESERRIDCIRFAEETISIEKLIYEEFGHIEYGVYKMRIKHAKSGYSSFKFIYFPPCSLEKTGFFPSNDGYEISRLRFSCQNDLYIVNSKNEEIAHAEIPVSESIFEGSVCYKERSVPFRVHLKAFTWEIFNEEKSFGADNKKSYISSTDIKESAWVMLNVHNHTDKTYMVEICCGENFCKTYFMGANRKFSFNLKELSENIDASKEAFSIISIKVSDYKNFPICCIKKQIYVRGLKWCSGDNIEGNKVVFCWDEDGSLSDREMVIADLILPYKKYTCSIEDGEKFLAVDKKLFAGYKTCMVFVRHIETGGQSIYDDIDVNEKIYEVEKCFPKRKFLLTSQYEEIEEMIETEKPDFSQMIYSYLFLRCNKCAEIGDKYYKELEQKHKILLNIYKERIIEYRSRFGDAEFYKNFFKYDLDEKQWQQALKDLALTMPCFLSDQRMNALEEEMLEENNLIAYIDYLFTTRQETEILKVKQIVDKIKDEESFVLAKADLIFPRYSSDREIFKSIQEWKRMQIDHKWPTDTEALCYTMIDVILDDFNKRLNRVNAQYSNAVNNLYTKYKRTLLESFVHRLEKKRR